MECVCQHRVKEAGQKHMNEKYKERQTVLTLFLKDRRIERRIVGYCTDLQNKDNKPKTFLTLSDSGDK